MREDAIDVNITREDLRQLRRALAEYYGTAAASGMPGAVIDLAKAETMSDEAVIEDALDKGLISLF